MIPFLFYFPVGMAPEDLSPCGYQPKGHYDNNDTKADSACPMDMILHPGTQNIRQLSVPV